MGLCHWETLHTPKEAFMEELYTVISNLLFTQAQYPQLGLRAPL